MTQTEEDIIRLKQCKGWMQETENGVAYDWGLAGPGGAWLQPLKKQRDTMKFKDLTLNQKRKLLHEEYLSDGADEKIINDGLIPEDYKSVINRLRSVFGYKDDMEVEV